MNVQKLSVAALTATMLLASCGQQSSTVPRPATTQAAQAFHVISKSAVAYFSAAATVTRTADALTVRSSGAVRTFPADAITASTTASRGTLSFLNPYTPCYECGPAGPPVNGPSQVSGNANSITFDSQYGLEVTFTITGDNMTYTMNAYDPNGNSIGSQGMTPWEGPSSGTGAISWEPALVGGSPYGADVTFYNNGTVVGHAHYQSKP